MPLRPARAGDLSKLAEILVDAYTEDNMYQRLYPNWQAHPAEVLRGFHEKLVESYWHYGRRIVVAYKNGPDDTEIITGVAVWERCGPGWEGLWGVGGWWDPRSHLFPLVEQYYEYKRLLYPNLAALPPTSQDPDPVTHVNIKKVLGPFAGHLWSAPHRQIHWELPTLAVSREFQSKGIGTELIAEGLALAEHQKLPSVCIAKDGKEDWYRKRGFDKLVGFVTKEGGEENPLPRRGIKGGAVMWTW